MDAASALVGTRDHMTRRWRMSSEANKAIVRRYFDEVWNGGDLDLIDPFFSPHHPNPNPSTGHVVVGETIAIDRFADGRIVEHWARRDALGLFQQLGLLPPLPRAAE